MGLLSLAHYYAGRMPSLARGTLSRSIFKCLKLLIYLAFLNLRFREVLNHFILMFKIMVDDCENLDEIGECMMHEPGMIRAAMD